MNMFHNTGIESYLSDESGIVGSASWIAFPQSKADLCKLLHIVREAGEPLTIQGARTGLRGQAVPQGGYIINLTKMCAIEAFRFDSATSSASVKLQAGVTLEQLDDWLRIKAPTEFADDESKMHWERYCSWDGTLYFVPNPSEKTATLGGLIAEDAVGSYVLCGGDLAQNILDKDVILSENVIVSLTLALHPRPAQRYGLMSYHKDCAEAEAFVETMRGYAFGMESTQVLAAEWFDSVCREILADTQNTHLLPDAVSLWTEFAADSEDRLLTLLAHALELLEQADIVFADRALVVAEGRDFNFLQNIRHTLTERLNEKDYGALPLLLDCAVLPNVSAKAVSTIKEHLEGAEIPYALMGRAATGHITVRLLPNEAHHAAANQIIERLADELSY